MPKVSWLLELNGEETKNYKAINCNNNWTLLPSELKRLMPKMIFKHKLKVFLLNYFNL